MIKNISLIILAPFITLALYVGAKGGKISPPDLVTLMRNILFCSIVTVIISAIVYWVVKKFKKGILISVILSEIIFVPLLTTFLLISNAENRARTEMWLPVIMLFMIINTLPMALLISYAMGKIFKRE